MTRSLGAGLQEQHRVLPSCLREPSSLSPASVISCKHSVMEWEPQVPICPPRFIRTGAPGSSHSGGILGPKSDHQREEHLFVTSARTGRARSRPIYLWRASSPFTFAAYLQNNHQHPPQACIMLISPSPSSGASLKVFVLSQNQV